MTGYLTPRSMHALAGVHPDLVKVLSKAAEYGTLDFVVTEGVRTLERQKALLAHGATTTLNSRHLTGHAADLAVVVAGEVRWDWPLYRRLAEVVKAAARDVDVPIEAGADWTTFPDGPHFQLPWKEYPEAKEAA